MNSVNSSLKSPWRYEFAGPTAQPDGFKRGPQSSSALLGLPAQTNPLADVIGQASPQSFHPDLNHPAQAKLTQPELIFKPGVGGLSHPGALLVDLDRLLGLHLGLKGQHGLTLLLTQHRAAFFTTRTTLRLKGTRPTHRSTRSVAPLDPALLFLLGGWARRYQFTRVRGALADAHPDNNLGLGIGGDLDIVSRNKSTFGTDHDARLRIGGTDPRLFGWVLVFCLWVLFFARFSLILFKLFDRLERRLESLLFIAQRSLTGRRLARAQFLRIRLAPGLELLACPFEMAVQGRLASKALIGGRRLDLGAIMHHSFERDQPVMAEHPHHLHKQLIEGLLMRYPEVRQRVVVDHFHPGQPLVGRMILTQLFELMRRVDHVAIGIQPQTEQHPRLPHR